MNCTLSMACRITIWSHRMANRHVILNLTNRHPMRTLAYHNCVLTSLKLHLYFLIWRQYYKSCKYLIKLEYLRGSKRSDWWLRTGPYIYKGLSSHSLQGHLFIVTEIIQEKMARFETIFCQISPLDSGVISVTENYPANAWSCITKGHAIDYVRPVIIRDLTVNISSPGWTWRDGTL